MTTSNLDLYLASCLPMTVSWLSYSQRVRGPTTSTTSLAVKVSRPDTVAPRSFDVPGTRNTHYSYKDDGIQGCYVLVFSRYQVSYTGSTGRYAPSSLATKAKSGHLRSSGHSSRFRVPSKFSGTRYPCFLVSSGARPSSRCLQHQYS